jgi:hypothetical protein
MPPSTKDGGRRTEDYRLPAAIVALAAVPLALFPRFTVDDAYITLRYAENLAWRGELVFNAGEDPVEGYTGVALPVLLAALVRAGADPIAAGRGVGVASLFVGAALLWALLGRLGVRDAVRAVATCLYLLAPFQATHALAGLETTLFGAAILGAVYALARCLHAPPEAPRASAEAALWLALLFAGLARPEGAVLAAAAALALGYERARRGGLAGAAGRFSLLYLLPGAAYFAWRWSYYGLPLPNTYYAKWAARTYWDSVRGMAAFAVLYLAAPAAAAAALLVAGGRGAWRELCAPRWRALLLAACALFVAAVFFQYRRSALIMNFSHRFFAPFLPLLLAVFAAAAEAGLRALREAPRGKRRLALAAVVLAAVLQAAACVREGVSEVAFARATRDLLASEHVPAGLFLRERVPEGAWVAVVLDAGAIPYFSRRKTVDVGGLNDEFLGKRWYTRMQPGPVADYVFGHDPAAFVFTSHDWERVEHPNAADFTADPRFARYVLAAKYRSDTVPDYYQFVYLREDLAGRP